MAEDNPDHQQLLTMVLTDSRPRVSVVSVATGEELLAKVREAGPDGFDCFILDFNLPDCQSADLLRILSKETEGRPAILISSSRSQSVVIESLRKGSVDFVPKTEAVEGDTLWQRVQLALKDYRRTNSERRRLVRRHQNLVELAETDPLTGLSNRRCLNRLLRGRGASFDRRGHASVIMLDVDHFKRVNDRFGHLVGDQVLIGVADGLRERAGKDDLVCRWGGEEFLVVRPAASLGTSVLWAEDLRRDIEKMRFDAAEPPLSITISVGIAHMPSAQIGIDTIAQADEALYLAKKSGRNCVCTQGMVQFEKAIVDGGGKAAARLDERLRQVLTACRSHLGPTQYDHLTEHAEYVSAMAVRIGRAMQMDADALERLRTAGLCHDLGKLIVPEDVLAKPSALNTDERRLVSRHPEVGAALSRRLGCDAITSDFIRYHHQFFGNHPSNDGPAGAALPLGSRVLAVADAFVTMTSERPYRSACSLTSAVAELRRSRGTQFDPTVVDAVPRALLASVPVGRS